MILFRVTVFSALVWLCSIPEAAHASVTGDGETSWVRYENDYFEAFTNAPPSKALFLLEDLQNFRAAMISYDGSRVPEGSNRTRVIIFASKEDFVEATGHSLIEALTLGIEGTPHIIMSAEASPEWSRTTLRHEFIHVLQGYAGDESPWWFFEGFAECMSAMELRMEETAFVIGEPTIRSRSKRLFVPWEDLIANNFTLDNVTSAEQGSSAYFQAGLLVRYLLLDDRRVQSGRITEYLDRVTSGESSAAAFESVFGEPVDELAKRVYRQRRKSIKPKSYDLESNIEKGDFRQSVTTRSVVQEMIDALREQGR